MSPFERRRERARNTTAWAIALGMGVLCSFAAIPFGGAL